MDLVQNATELRIYPVGRLDRNTTGLLLLTNDGDLTRALELPSNGWVRRYRARAYGRITQDKLDKLKDGITVEGVHYGPIEARLDKVQDRSGLVQRLMGFGARPAIPPPGAKKRDRKASVPEYRQGRKSYTTWFDEACVRPSLCCSM